MDMTDLPWSRAYRRLKDRWRAHHRRRQLRDISRRLPQLFRGGAVDFSAIREQLLRDLISYAERHSPYFARLFSTTGVSASRLNRFDRLPLLSKEIIRRCQTDMVSTEIASLDVYTMNTGGSTGEPLEFLVSTIAGTVDGLHQEHHFRNVMHYTDGDRIAAFDGSSVPQGERDRGVYWIQNGGPDLPYGSMSYSSLYLDSNTVPSYVDHMIRARPAILRGYPSFLHEIALYLIDSGLQLPFAPKGIQLTAENPLDGQIADIERVFRCPVYLQYGHSEVSVFAYTAAGSREYRCSPLYGLTEVLREDGTPVREGETGEVVVTGFWNTAMPFIRYRTGDMAVFAGDENGVVRLARVTGRTQDFIYGINGVKTSLTALIFGQHYRAFRNIRRWQLEQWQSGSVLIRLVRGEEFSTQDEDEIRQKFLKIASVDAVFEFVDDIPLSKRGKFQFVIQHIQPETVP